MSSTLIRVLGALGGGTVLFYTLGFTVVRTYMHKIGLEGMFWLTKEFYVDAGANFLLEMISAPLLTPQIFFIYLIVLFLLLPREEKLIAFAPNLKTEESKEDASVKRRQRAKLSILLLSIIVTSIFASQYEYLIGQSWFARLINVLVLDPTTDTFSPAKKSLAFFSFVTPVVIVMSTFLYRFYGSLQEGPRIKLFYQVTAIIFMVFMAIIPISYGLHLYDWKLVTIKDPLIISNVIARERGSEPLTEDGIQYRVWLLGQFDNKYFFFTKRGLSGEGTIEVINENKISFLNFDPYHANSLRTEIDNAFKVRETERLDTDEDIFDYLELE